MTNYIYNIEEILNTVETECNTETYSELSCSIQLSNLDMAILKHLAKSNILLKPLMQKINKQTNKNKFHINTTINCLTKREIEILKLLSTGKIYKEIAQILGVALDTVKRHCNNIYSKLNVGNKTEAINLWRSGDN